MSTSTAGSANDPDSTKNIVADFVTTFAGVMLLITACMGILQGISAIADPDLYAAGSDYLYKLNLTAWGWVHVVIGVLSFAVGIGILMGRSWGQAIGVIVVGLSALTNFVFLPHYPLWSITLIAIDVLIIAALCTQLKRR